MTAKPTVSNPGPRWGYQTIAFLEKYLPAVVFNGLLSIGTFIGLLVMSERRAHSRRYLEQIGKPSGLMDQYRHFRAFMDSLVLKLQAGRGKFPQFRFAQDAHDKAFIQLCRNPGPVLFGTFHVGFSDMIGCMLKDFDRPISMVRLRVGNSLDTEMLEKTFAGYLRFIWINEPEEFLFSLKKAVEEGSSIGFQCDRIEFGSKLGHFDFLGARRAFPMTIYHIAHLFQIPVVFAFTGPIKADGEIDVYTSPVFQPASNRKESLGQAAEHFQEVLNSLECHLQKYPELWFNFLPLNKEVDRENI